jgi:hypothetical protein
VQCDQNPSVAVTLTKPPSTARGQSVRASRVEVFAIHSNHSMPLIRIRGGVACRPPAVGRRSWTAHYQTIRHSAFHSIAYTVPTYPLKITCTRTSSSPSHITLKFQKSQPKSTMHLRHSISLSTACSMRNKRRAVPRLPGCRLMVVALMIKPLIQVTSWLLRMTSSV